MNRNRYHRHPQKVNHNGGLDQRNSKAASAMHNNRNSSSNSQGAIPKQNGAAEVNKHWATGECVVCRKMSVCVCERCGDYYCSPQCQRDDWPRHRYICFPMPALVQPKFKVTTENVFPNETPLLTAARISNEPPENQQRILDDIFKMSPNSKNEHLSASQQSVPSDRSRVKQRQEPQATMQSSSIPKANSHVMLTGFRTPNRCYVRSLQSADDEDYLLSARKIDSYGKCAPTLKTVPPVNSYAIAELSGVMCRVEILMARNRDNIRVLFCDRGVTGTRRLDELREINNDIIRLQQHAVMVPLRNVSNFALNNKLLEYLTQFEDMEFKLKTDGRNEKVELLHWQNEKSLNDEIERYCKEVGALVYQTGEKNNDSITTATGSNEGTHDEQYYAADESGSQKSATASMMKRGNKATINGHVEKEVTINKKKPISTALKKTEEEQPVLVAPFETKVFKVNSGGFRAIVVDTSCLEYGYIGCVAEKDWAYFGVLHKELAAININDEPYTPKLNEYCIAKFEDIWYRAKVIDIQDAARFTVMFVDFTNDSVVTDADIRRYPLTIKSDCRTSLCLIDGLPSDLSAELVQFLKQEITMQSEITIDKVKEIDEQVVVIECNSLKEKIRKVLR